MGLQKDIELDSGFTVGYHDIEELRINFKEVAPPVGGIEVVRFNCQARVGSYKSKAAKAAGKKPQSLEWVSFNIEELGPTLRKAIDAIKLLPKFDGSTEPV